MCFGARFCVVPNGTEEVLFLVVTGEFFVFFVVVVMVGAAHWVRWGKNGNFGKNNSFPLKLCLVGFLLWMGHFVYAVVSLLGLMEANVHYLYLSLFLGTCTPMVFLVMCLVGDKVYRGCLQYVCGFKAYDELFDSENIEMEQCNRI